MQIRRRSGVATAACAVFGMVAFALGTVAAAGSQPIAQAELLVEQRMIAPGQPFLVGFRLTLAEGWHTYWRNPGDSGMALAIDWHLPPGFSHGPLAWPTPEVFRSASGVTYGFKRHLLVLTNVTPPADLPIGSSIEVGATAEWLVCREICVPEVAELAVPLRVDASAVEDAGSKTAFTAARAFMPIVSPWPATYRVDQRRVHLAIDIGSDANVEGASARFYPYAGATIEHGAEQTTRVDGGRLWLELKLADGVDVAPQPLRGVIILALNNQSRAFEITADYNP
jgi:DsbC/DsbD-like thiol-disulfide interchange protein